MKHGQKYKMAKRAGFLLHTNIHIELTNTLAKLFIKKKNTKKKLYILDSGTRNCYYLWISSTKPLEIQYLFQDKLIDQPIHFYDNFFHCGPLTSSVLIVSFLMPCSPKWSTVKQVCLFPFPNSIYHTLIFILFYFF